MTVYATFWRFLVTCVTTLGSLLEYSEYSSDASCCCGRHRLRGVTTLSIRDLNNYKRWLTDECRYCRANGLSYA